MTMGAPVIPEDELDQQLNLEQLKNELVERNKTELEVENMKKLEDNIGLPYKLHGIQKMPKDRAYYIFERILIESQIPHQFLTDYMEKIFYGTLHAIVDEDYEFLKEYLETSFFLKLKDTMAILKEKEYTLKMVEDVIGNFGEPVQSSAKIFDAVVIRGLRIDRKQNGSQEDYHVFKDIEDMGVVVYTPKKVQDPENFINPEENKKIYDDTKVAVGRVLLKFKSPVTLKVFTKEGFEVKIDESLNTWQHLAIFETDLKNPPEFKSRYKMEGHIEWVSKFKPTKWVLVDMDNWMLGNPLITEGNKMEEYKDEIFKKSEFDPNENIDLRNV